MLGYSSGHQSGTGSMTFQEDQSCQGGGNRAPKIRFVYFQTDLSSLS